MGNQTNANRVKYLAAAAAAAVFTAAVYFLPTETFFGLFSAGLFLIPASLFVYLIQKVAEVQEHHAGK